MRLTGVQIERLVRRVMDEMKSQQVIEFKTPEEKVFRRAVALIEEQFRKESELDKEVHRMLDDLEKQNPGQFQRGKMFGMVKKRLAKEKGIIL